MKKYLRYLVIFTSIIVLSYNIWSASGRKSPPSTFQETCSTEQEVFGTNSGRGNLIGIQPKLSPIDFTSETSFFNAIDDYLREAQRVNFFTDRSVVVFPEYIGTWLVAVDEKEAVYTASKLQEAMEIMVNSNLGNFLISYATAPNVKNKTAYSLFMMKSQQMAAIYHRTFSRLANKYQVTIVAGSIILPNPQIKNNQLITGSGDLYNVTVIYQPKGTPYPQIIKKVFLTSDEEPFTTAGKLTETPIFPLPIGNTAILICTDSWFPETYEHLENTEVIIVPSYSKENSWSQGWQGYSDYSVPNNVEKKDIGTLTQEQAWLKYSLAERIKTTKAKVGMSVFLRGQFWELGSDGFPILVKDGKAIQGLRVRGASITCLWL